MIQLMIWQLLTACVETMSHEDAVAAALSRRRHRRDGVLSLSLPRRDDGPETNELAQTRQRNHPLLLETTHGVKAPQHFKTRRARHAEDERHHLVAEDLRETRTSS